MRILIVSGRPSAITGAIYHPDIGGVSGHAKVGNLRSFIARCQSLEYIVGFNLDRRAYTRWNCITVLPGAISAIRKQAIDRAGGLSLDTLAEDTDLTLSLHKQQLRSVYVPGAVAWTEAPETVRTLSRQRFRWAYGTLQCLWKHRDMVFNWKYRALGWFSLPSIWFFQIILVAITPAVDLFLILSLPFGAWRDLLPFVIVFLATDVILATLACILERENRSASVADHSDALDLSPDVELLRLESYFARCKGRMGKLGQAGTHCFRAGASVASAFPRVIPTGA